MLKWAFNPKLRPNYNESASVKDDNFNTLNYPKIRKRKNKIKELRRSTTAASFNDNFRK